MRELVYYVAVSLDGFIAAPDGTFDAFPVEGDHMAVLMTEFADAIPAHVQRALGLTASGSLFDTVVMGWNTYAVGVAEGYDSPYAHLRQIVATRRAQKLPEGVLGTSDPIETVRLLKAEEQGAAIYLCGGGALAGTLIDEIDRLVLKVNPVVLGDGIPLVRGGRYDPARFTRTSVRTFDSGVTLLDYRRRAEA